MNDEFRRVLLAVALSMMVWIGISYIFPQPKPEDSPPAEASNQTSQTADIKQDAAASQAENLLPRSEAVAVGERLPFENDEIKGSIALQGASVDDLLLKKYKVSLDSEEEIVLLSPLNAQGKSSRFEAGWLDIKNQIKEPNAQSVWQADGAKLTPETPVTLSWDNGEGLTFIQKFEMDDNYLFTVSRSVINNTDQAVDLIEYQQVVSVGEQDVNRLVRTGAVSYFNELYNERYNKMEAGYREDFPKKPKDSEQVQGTVKGGWMGLSDRYWLTAVLPAENQEGQAYFRRSGDSSNPIYQAVYKNNTITIAPQSQSEASLGRFYSGAKEYNVMVDVSKTYNVDRFQRAIDFGLFYYITQPFLKILTWLYHHIGNMGIAIISLTVLVKLVLFPLAFKSYKSMARMKTLQPKMQALKEKYGDDRQGMQQATMELYKKEKVNPAAGCLPMLIQIPIFFSLYKVLNIAIEMRHAPFFGWIHDLSSPDPTSWLNAFGLLPWSGMPSDWAPAFSMINILALGVWPLLMGVSMYLQQTLNPTPADKQQAMIFKWLPVVFTFMMGGFAAGLVIYWTANNILTFGQQWVINRNINKEAKA
ncbi:MAG: membrane protein insertase YidC [Alphaproteobacteria bacterium]